MIGKYHHLKREYQENGNNFLEKGMEKIKGGANKLYNGVKSVTINIASAVGGVTGTLLGAAKGVEDGYATPALDSIVQQGYMTCGPDNAAQGVEFIVDSCPKDMDYSLVERVLRGVYENMYTLGDNIKALLDTVKQIDLPTLPKIAELPDYSGLQQIIERSQDLGSFNLLNLGEYADLALQFMDYFSKNGKALMDFLSSDIVTEFQTFYETAQQAYVALEQGLGYMNVLTSTPIPGKEIGIKAAIGFGLGIVLAGGGVWATYKLAETGVKKTKELIDRKRQERDDAETDIWLRERLAPYVSIDEE